MRFQQYVQIILEAQQINLTIGYDKHNFKEGVKGSTGCCCSIFNDENGKTVSYYT